MDRPIKRAACKTSHREPVARVAAVSAPSAAPTAKGSAKAAAASSAKISADERHALIAEAAYFVALRNGSGSNAQQNWDQAAAQIDAELKAEGRL